MAQLPNEIIIAIGRYLTRHSILNSVMVCRQWHQVLGPFLWSFIFKKAWHHPRFAIKFYSVSSDSSLAPYLRHVKLFEWHNNHSLISRRAISESQARDQIPTARLGLLISMMSNLDILLLRAESQGADSALFEAMRGLQHLRVLKINIHEGDEDLIPIESMFPLFSRLDELCLEGSWYRRENDPVLDLNATEKWRMKRLTVSPQDAQLARHCPDLEHLRLLPRVLSMKRKMGALSNLMMWELLAPGGLKGLIVHARLMKRCFAFKVHDTDGVHSERPHKVLSPEKKTWWSSGDIVALL
ncbi:hypothetical protein EC957_010578 [Mortierella hygrophila]|uniref:F-box domain-containing protein n=1 Tax=Mortierella hygrophila TaxID=979708 RepID=A0A9P6FAP7_9FUNG|nr:hypothetical protein EC957_010578 [Mortierella hygrophila]